MPFARLPYRPPTARRPFVPCRQRTKLRPAPASGRVPAPYALHGRRFLPPVSTYHLGCTACAATLWKRCKERILNIRDVNLPLTTTLDAEGRVCSDHGIARARQVAGVTKNWIMTRTWLCHAGSSLERPGWPPNGRMMPGPKPLQRPIRKYSTTKKNRVRLAAFRCRRKNGSINDLA